MSELFGIDIQTVISDAMSGQLKPATLTRYNTDGLTYVASRDRYENSEGEPVEPTTVDFTSEGIVSNYSDGMISGGHATEQDRKIMLLAKNLGTEPKIGDVISIEGQEYTVTGVPSRDPASATWTIRGQI